MGTDTVMCACCFDIYCPDYCDYSRDVYKAKYKDKLIGFIFQELIHVIKIDYEHLCDQCAEKYGIIQLNDEEDNEPTELPEFEIPKEMLLQRLELLKKLDIAVKKSMSYIH